MEQQLSVAILLADAQRSDELAELLESKGQRAVAMSGADALHERLHAESYDVLIVADALDGFLSGSEILARLPAGSVRKKSILVAEPTPAMLTSAHLLRIAKVVSPQAPLAELADIATGVAKLQLLVIEDELAIVNLIRRMLESFAVEVRHVTNSVDALDLAPPIDAILCDVHLGDEDGIGLIQQFRTRGFRGPVVMISGDHQRATVERSLSARINGYLLKPFTRETLLNNLQTFIDLSAAAAPALALPTAMLPMPDALTTAAN